VHLIIATQRPDVASIPGSVKANLDGRICGHMADNTSSIVVLDNANAAKLPAIPGRFILRDGAGVEVAFQAYLLG
jgi:DNA segregation ATPase FtsK/SpoIIIE-like protein